MLGGIGLCVNVVDLGKVLGVLTGEDVGTKFNSLSLFFWYKFSIFLYMLSGRVLECAVSIDL